MRKQFVDYLLMLFFVSQWNFKYPFFSFPLWIRWTLLFIRATRPIDSFDQSDLNKVYAMVSVNSFSEIENLIQQNQQSLCDFIC